MESAGGGGGGSSHTGSGVSDVTHSTETVATTGYVDITYAPRPRTSVGVLVARA